MVCYETTKEEPLPSGKGRNFMAGFPNKDTLFTQGKSKEVCRKDKWRGEFFCKVTWAGIYNKHNTVWLSKMCG